ncbi:hypothetical protein BH11ACT6_BH11ACT6_54530 [soil metagenome]
MPNDAVRHEFEHVLALVQGQMKDLSDLQQRQSEIAATAAVADGTVEVTVNGQRMITKTVIDDAFLEDYELAELGGYVTRAAQTAAQEVERRSAALITPLNERRKAISEMAADVIDIPELPDIFSRLNAFSAGQSDSNSATDAGGEEDSAFPTVRR